MIEPAPEDTDLSNRVIEAVASAEDVEPTELEPPLHAVVDPGSLDSVFNTDAGAIRFPYCGYEVVADASGTVELDPDT